MIELRRSVVIDRTQAEVFSLISNPDRLREFFVGITRWEPRSARTRGKGARFKVLMKVGAAEAGGVVEITQWREGRTIAWKGEQGVEHSGRWTLRRTPGGTALELEIRYVLPGPLGWLVERITARMVGRNMTATVLAARRILEYEDRLSPRTAG